MCACVFVGVGVGVGAGVGVVFVFEGIFFQRAGKTTGQASAAFGFTSRDL